MTYLDCSVTGCVYTENHCCCKREIVVEGKDAKENRGTFCGSFKERTESGSAKSASGKAEPEKETNVSCEAQHCRFNDACKCTAKHIGIAGGNVCSSVETECASFECR